jgi:hypothetical protein
MNRATRILTAAVAILIVAGGGSRASDAGAGAHCYAGERCAKQLFIDVHELSPGGVSLEAVAEAHAKDLAVQGSHGVEFETYWVDEEAGLVYCLSRAPDAASVVSTHRDAHGLLPTAVLPVSEGQAARLRGEGRLFLDIHRLGAGNVSAKAVAEAHAKDLAVQGAHGVNFVQYWVDETDGVVLCLSEAPDSDAVRATHREAHGLLPDRILEVTQGE